MKQLIRFCASLVFIVATAAAGQAFPTKPVHIVVGFPAGTSVDIIARLLSERLSQSWGQSVVVENRTGAGGNIGAGYVANTAPDGHTILLANNGVAISASLYSGLAYNATRDLAPVNQISYLPHVLVTSADFPANSIRELIALAKSRPGTLNFGSGGVGNSDHMAGELFKSMAGIDIVHVPYKGGTDAMNDAIGGRVAMYFSGVPAALPLLKAGRLKALGTSGKARSPALPDVPTIDEAGVPGYEVTLWNGFFVPAATPPAIVAKIAEDTNRILKLPDVRARLEKMGLEVSASSPDQFKAYFASEVAKWGDVVRKLGLAIKK